MWNNNEACKFSSTLWSLKINAYLAYVDIINELFNPGCPTSWAIEAINNEQIWN